MKTPEEKYKNDPHYRALVDMMVAHIKKCDYTPSEMREASILACTIYEMERPLNMHSVNADGTPIDKAMDEVMRGVDKYMKDNYVTVSQGTLADPIWSGYLRKACRSYARKVVEELKAKEDRIYDARHEAIYVISMYEVQKLLDRLTDKEPTCEKAQAPKG